jgi:hypothetical protein
MAAPPCPPPAGANGNNTINSYYKPDNAFDGNTGTWWAGAQAQTVCGLFDNYATDTYIGAVDIAYYADTHASVSTVMYTSADGDTWTNAGAFPGGAFTTLNVRAQHAAFACT